MKKLSIPAQECIYIDNGIRNILTAKSLGIHSILFNRDNKDYNGEMVYFFSQLDNILENI